MSQIQQGTLHKAVIGGKWVAFGSISNKLLGIVSFLVLARFLDPAHYGIIAIVMMVSGLFNQMLVTGFETALMQRQGEVEKYFDTIWTFNLIKGLCIFAIIYASAPLIAGFFHVEHALILIRWSGIFVIFPSLAPLKLLHLFRDLRFDKIYYRDIAGQIGYIAVGALYVFFVAPDVWALFWANVARYVIPVIVVYIYFPVLPKLRLHLGRLRELIPFSKWIVGQNAVDYLTSLIDNLFIGRLLNPYTLGLYTKARNLSAIAYAPIGGINKNLSFVAFSKVQDEKPKLQEGFFMIVDLTLFFGLTNIFFTWLGADAIIGLVLGPTWLQIIPALKIFTVATLLSSFFSNAYSLFDGSGKPMVTFKAKVMSLIFYAVFSYYGILWKSMAGAAIGIVLSNLLIVGYVSYKMKKIYAIQFSSHLKRLLLVIIPYIPPLTAYYFLYDFLITLTPIWMIISLCCLYGMFFVLFWWLGRRYERGCWQTIMTSVRILIPSKPQSSI